jgi:hypothetical protein
MPDPTLAAVLRRPGFRELAKIANLLATPAAPQAGAQPLVPSIVPHALPAPPGPATTPQTPVQRPLSSLFPTQAPTSGIKATAMPGTPGTAATNVIDRLGGLDASGRTIDGNHAAGISKGANWLGGLFRGAARGLRPVGREALQTGAGAAAGLGLTGLEHVTGYSDPNMSGQGHTGLAAIYMLLAASLANPRSRRLLLNRTVMSPVAGQPGLYAQAPSGRFMRPIGLAGLAVAAPRLTATADAGSRTIRGLNEAMENDPGLVERRVREWTDPQHLVSSVVTPQVTRVLNSPQVNNTARIFSHSVATNLAGLLGGGLVGYGTGQLAGKAFLPDDEKLPYESRRWRERLRAIISSVGSSGGSILGAYLANRFTPPPKLASLTRVLDL